jgi:segregation and condensation protein A
MAFEAPAPAFEVSTPVFEGPFDLLYHLIVKEQVDIYEVSLSSIIEKFIRELAELDQVALGPCTEFLVIAASLVELKTRRLLPGSDDFDLDDELLLDQRDALLARLLEYKTFKDASAALRQLLDRASRSVPRTVGPEEPFASLVPDPLAAVTPHQIRDAARKALTPRLQERIDLDAVAPLRISVREAVEIVLAGLPRRGSITFRQLTIGLRVRIDVIVRFLAVLELFKQGIVDIDQPEQFGDISIRLLDEPTEIDLAAMEADWGEQDATARARETEREREHAAGHRRDHERERDDEVDLVDALGGFGALGAVEVVDDPMRTLEPT